MTKKKTNKMWRGGVFVRAWRVLSIARGFAFERLHTMQCSYKSSRLEKLYIFSLNISSREDVTLLWND